MQRTLDELVRDYFTNSPSWPEIAHDTEALELEVQAFCRDRRTDGGEWSPAEVGRAMVRFWAGVLAPQ